MDHFPEIYVRDYSLLRKCNKLTFYNENKLFSRITQFSEYSNKLIDTKKLYKEAVFK